MNDFNRGPNVPDSWATILGALLRAIPDFRERDKMILAFWDDLESQWNDLSLELAEARRRLLSAAGDDLCRLTQEEIKAFTSGSVPIPPKEEFLPSCDRFHDQIAGKAGVNHNCLTLAQLIAENERLRMELEHERLD